MKTQARLRLRKPPPKCVEIIKAMKCRCGATIFKTIACLKHKDYEYQCKECGRRYASNYAW